VLSALQYSIDVLLLVMYSANTYLIVKKVSSFNKRDEQKRIKEIVKEYMMSDEFREVVKHALDDSQISKDVELLRLVLCTRLDEIKHTKICNELRS
jgi:hypothetical protein